jgi:hypothetical protein
MFERAGDTDLGGTLESNIHSRFLTVYGKGRSKTMYDTLYDTLQMVVDNKADILKTINSGFSKELSKEVIDYYHLNILKYLEAFHFLSNYASEWLTVVVTEALNESTYAHLPDIKLSKVYVSDVENILQIGQVCLQLNQPFETFLKEIHPLKGHQVNDFDWKANPEETAKRVDKFKSGFIPVKWNPTYHIGIMYATWAAKQDEKTKDEYERLQQLLMQLRDKRDGTTDKATRDRLEHQIKYHSDRVNKAQIQIAKLEDRYGL